VTAREGRFAPQPSRRTRRGPEEWSSRSTAVKTYGDQITYRSFGHGVLRVRRREPGSNHNT
jgi:hypothetical protein